MRFVASAVVRMGAGALALTAASCERRDAGPVAPRPATEVVPARPARVPPPPYAGPPAPPSPVDSGTGGAGGAPADGGAGARGATRQQPRDAPGGVAARGAHGAIGHVEVQGSLARTDVERVLRDGVPKLKACRSDGGGGKGQVDLALTIGEQGWATLAEVKRTTLGGGDPELCIVKALRALRFPRPSDGKETAVSFVLQFR